MAVAQSAERVAFIGLGAMGAPMAMNLVKSGFAVTGISRRPHTLPELSNAGVSLTNDASAISGCDIIFLCLPDLDAVKSVLFRGVDPHPALRRGHVVVDTSTIPYRPTTEIAKQLADRGISFLDAPITGMRKRACEGTLTAMCGGPSDVFFRILPMLEAFASDVLFMGPSGSGQLAKLVNQLLFDINAAALAEILPIAVKLGLDPDSIERIVNGGTGRSYASEFFIPNILRDEFQAGYPLEAAYKDLVSGMDLFVGQKLPAPVLSAALHTYQRALLEGHGHKDKGAMICVFEDLLGVRFRSALSCAATRQA